MAQNALLSAAAGVHGGLVNTTGDRTALVALYEATNGSAWHTATGWLGGMPPCSPDGVANWGACSSSQCEAVIATDGMAYVTNTSSATCAGICCSATGAVTAVLLHANGLRGELPTELGLATTLQHLYTGATSLYGSLPTQLGNATALRGLATFSTFISGSLPTNLGHLTGLQRLITRTTFLSGVLPTQLGLLTAPLRLFTGTTSISGSLPTQLGLATALQGLQVSNTSVSGSLPTQLGKVTSLRRMFTDTTSISGFLPTELGLATALQHLATSSTSISGILPTQLGRLDKLLELNLTDCNLAPLDSPPDLLAFELATVHCGVNPTVCYGLPPLSCTAFKGENNQLVLDSLTSCVDCSGEIWPYTLLVVLLQALLILAVGSLAHLSAKHGNSPAVLARWGGTGTMLIQHVQAIGLIGSIDFAWPSSVTALMGYISFDFLQVPQLACIFPGSLATQASIQTNGQNFLFNMIVCGSALGILSVCALAVAMLHCARRHDAADTLELTLSVIFSVPLATTWRALASLFEQSSNALDASGDAQDRAETCRSMAKHENCSLPIEFQTHRNFNGYANQLTSDANALTSLASRGIALGVALVVVQLALALRCTLNLMAFRRGVRTRVWHWGLRRWPIAPRHIAARCAYLRGHFAPHAPLWELAVWLRHLLLLSVGVGLESTMATLTNALENESTTSALHQHRFVARLGWECAALLVVCTMAWAQERTQPYALRLQNTLARWMYVTNALLVLIGTACTAVEYVSISSRTLTALLVFLVVLDVIIGCGFAIAILALEWYAVHSSTAAKEADLSDLLLAAVEPIDGPLRECLKDGSIRLVRASWLAGPDVGPVLRRRQELPDEAFVLCVDAVAMLNRGDRSILVASHCWMTPAHPDPLGVTLSALRRYLLAAEDRRGCGVFVDYCSLPQKSSNGERTPEERAVFSHGLSVMASLYASLTATTVLLQQRVPLLPDEIGGESIATPSSALARAAVAATTTPSHGTSAGSVTALVRTAQAVAGFKAGVRGGRRRAITATWNARQYGERGWCSFESGVARMAAAHMRRVVSQLEQQQRTAPDAVRRAEDSRPKIVDLGGDDEACKAPPGDPATLLRDISRLIEGAAFTNNADRSTVAHMLFALEYTMHLATDEVLSRGERRAGLTSAPSLSRFSFLKALVRGRAPKEVGPINDGVQLLELTEPRDHAPVESL